MFAFLGAIIGWFANSWLASLEFGEITGVIRVLSGQWSWLPWVSRIVCLISVAWITFYITDSETPVDKADYALVSAKSVGVALALGLIWSFLFSKITGGTVTFVLISVGIAAATVLVYAILEEL
jgi:hypothetical protein